MPFPRYHSQLNNSLDDIDIRYNSTTGKPEWRERGAGTFVPFSSSSIDGVFWNNSSISVVVNGHCYNDGGSYPGERDLATYINQYSDIVSVTISGLYGIFTFLKEGYYIWISAGSGGVAAPTHFNVGDTITMYITLGSGNNHGQPSCIMYLGASDPTQ